MKRTGNCFQDALEAILHNRQFKDCFDPLLVHGLPMGASGDAAKAGRYPHAWVEFNGGGIVWDPVADIVIDAQQYYTLGQIEYTVEYTVDQIQDMILEHNTYGPWDQAILDRDAEIEKMIEESQA